MRLSDEQKAIAWRIFDVRPKLSAESAVVIFNNQFHDPNLHLDALQMGMQFKWMLKVRASSGHGAALCKRVGAALP